MSKPCYAKRLVYFQPKVSPEPSAPSLILPSIRSYRYSPLYAVLLIIVRWALGHYVMGVCYWHRDTNRSCYYYCHSNYCQSLWYRNALCYFTNKSYSLWWCLLRQLQININVQIITGGRWHLSLWRHWTSKSLIFSNVYDETEHNANLRHQLSTRIIKLAYLRCLQKGIQLLPSNPKYLHRSVIIIIT